LTDSLFAVIKYNEFSSVALLSGKMHRSNETI